MELTINLIHILLATTALQGAVIAVLSNRVTKNQRDTVARVDAADEAADADRKRIDELHTRHFDLVAKVSHGQHDAKEMILATSARVEEYRSKIASEAVARANADAQLVTEIANLKKTIGIDAADEKGGE